MDEPSASKKVSGNLPGGKIPKLSPKKAKKVKDLDLKPGTGKGLSTKKDAMAALGYSSDGTPLKRKKGSKDPDAGNYEKELDGLGGKKKGMFRDRSKPFKARKDPRKPTNVSLAGVGIGKVAGIPRLVDKDGKKKIRGNSPQMGDQWKFRDGTVIPVHKYVRGKMVSDEEGIAYYNRRTGGKYAPDAMKEAFNVTIEEITKIVQEEIEKAIGDKDK